MLIPVKVSPHRRVWADVSFRYEKHIYANSPEELSKYILKYGHVSGIYTDEEIAHDLRRTVAALLRDGIPLRQVVEETSALYGVPQDCVEEVISACPPQ